MPPPFTVRFLCAAAALVVAAVPGGTAQAFVDVAASGDLVTAARWSPSDVGGRGLGDGAIQVLIEDGFAEAIATAVTGTAAPQDVADIETAVRAGFAAWQSPVLQFDVTFDGPVVRGADSGGEIDLFAVLSSDPAFDVDAFFGVTYLNWTFLPDRRLTNGSVLGGNAITGADIFFATDRLAAAAPSFTREQQLRALQRLVMHELGHALGFAHPHDAPALNYDTDGDPFDAMLIDPADPLADLIRSPNIDTSAVMARFPTSATALFNTALRNDDRGGRDALYPAPGAIPAICQPMPQPGCRSALASSLDISEAAAGHRDALLWTWRHGTATALVDFADPRAATRFSLCLYSGMLPAIAAELALPAGRAWTARPGLPLRYADALGTPHGVRQALLQPGGAQRARIAVKAAGPALPRGLLPLGNAPVVAQLVRADAATCWASTFDATAIDVDTAERFSATTR
jgi:hypothetical protein